MAEAKRSRSTPAPIETDDVLSALWRLRSKASRVVTPVQPAGAPKRTKSTVAAAPKIYANCADARYVPLQGDDVAKEKNVETALRLAAKRHYSDPDCALTCSAKTELGRRCQRTNCFLWPFCNWHLASLCQLEVIYDEGRGAFVLRTLKDIEKGTTITYFGGNVLNERLPFIDVYEQKIMPVRKLSENEFVEAIRANRPPGRFVQDYEVLGKANANAKLVSDVSTKTGKDYKLVKVVSTVPIPANSEIVIDVDSAIETTATSSRSGATQPPSVPEEVVQSVAESVTEDVVEVVAEGGINQFTLSKESVACFPTSLVALQILLKYKERICRKGLLDVLTPANVAEIVRFGNQVMATCVTEKRIPEGRRLPNIEEIIGVEPLKLTIDQDFVLYLIDQVDKSDFKLLQNEANYRRMWELIVGYSEQPSQQNDPVLAFTFTKGGSTYALAYFDPSRCPGNQNVPPMFLLFDSHVRNGARFWITGSIDSAVDVMTNKYKRATEGNKTGMEPISEAVLEEMGEGASFDLNRVMYTSSKQKVVPKVGPNPLEV